MSNIVKRSNSAVEGVLGSTNRNLTGTNSEAAGAGMNVQPQEQDALKQQQDALNSARQQILESLKQTNLLTPQLLSSLGFTQGPNGQFVDQGAPGGTMAEAFASGPEQQRINEMLRQRQIDALGGNINDPGLERNLGLQEQTLRNQLRAQLGSGYETSSPGMQALADFRQRSTEARYNVGKEALTTAAGLNNTNYLTAGGLRSQRVGDVFNATTSRTAPLLTALNTNTGQYSAPVAELGSIFQRGSTAELTQEQNQASIPKAFMGMF